MNKPTFLNLEQALSIMAEGKEIHTFRTGGAVMMGCDMPFNTILRKLKKHEETLQLSGSNMINMLHGLALIDALGVLFIETNPLKLQELRNSLETTESKDVKENENEGWGLFNCENSIHGELQLQHIHEMSVFANDDAAKKFVISMCMGGSQRHIRAIQKIQNECSLEFKDIKRVAKEMKLWKNLKNIFPKN